MMADPGRLSPSRQAWLFPVLLSAVVIGYVLSAFVSQFFWIFSVSVQVFKQAVWLLITIWVLVLIMQRRIHLPLYFAPVFLSIIVALASSLQHLDRLPLSFLQLFLTYGFFLQILIFANIRYDSRQINFMFWVIFLVAFICAIVGISEVLLGYSVLDNYAEEAIWRGSVKVRSSFFYHPGEYAWLLSTAGCLGVAAIFTSESTVARRRLIVLATLVIAVALFLTLRKKAIIAFLLASMFLIFTLTRSGRYRVMALLAALVMTLTLIYLFPEYTKALLLSLRLDDIADGTLTPRLKLTAGSIALADSNFPLGEGLSTFGSVTSLMEYSSAYHLLGLSSEYGLGDDDAMFILDTFWPMLLGEMGYLGTLFYAMALITLAAYLLKRRHHVTSSEVRFIVFAALCLLVKSILESLSTPIFSKTPNSLVIAFFCGAAISIIRNQSRYNGFLVTDAYQKHAPSRSVDYHVR